MYHKITLTSFFYFFLLISQKNLLSMEPKTSSDLDDNRALVLYTPYPHNDQIDYNRSLVISQQKPFNKPQDTVSQNTVDTTQKTPSTFHRRIEKEIIPATPTQRGMGVTWTVCTSLSALTNSLRSREGMQIKRGSAILEDLISGTITPENESCHHLCDEALTEFSKANNTEKLIAFISLWYEKNYGQIVPSQLPAQQAHKTLVNAQKSHLNALKEELSNININALAEINAATALIQQQFQAYVDSLTKIAKEHATNSILASDTHGNKYRETKKALCLLHELKGILPLNEQEECSDYEDFAIESKKVIKNHETINEDYDNHHLLEKIELSHEDSVIKTLIALRKMKIEIIHQGIKKLEDLTYDKDQK